MLYINQGYGRKVHQFKESKKREFCQTTFNLGPCDRYKWRDMEAL